MTLPVGALVLLLAFHGLGHGALRALRIRPTPLDAIFLLAAGWGLLITLSVIGAYAGIPLHITLAAGVIAGIGVIAASVLRGRDDPALERAGIAVLALAPALWAAVQFGSVQYDEFSHWLPNAFYLFANDTLPTAARPNLITGKQGYPIGIPFVTFAISAIEGGWDDRTGKILPLVLAALFAIVLAGAVLRTDRPHWRAIAIATLFTTLLNPFFDPRLAITTYSDVPTAFLLAALSFALWRAARDDVQARDWSWRAGAAALALVHLRETNFALVLVAAFSLPVAATLVPSHDGIIAGWRRSFAIIGRVLAAPIVAVAIWRVHLAWQAVPPDLPARVLADWNWSAPRIVVSALLTDRLANNPVLGVLAIGLALGLSSAAVLGWRRITGDMQRLLIGVALLTMAQTALLAFAYIAVFTPDEVSRAASTWRYASQLGPLFMLATAIVLPLDRLVPSGTGFWTGCPAVLAAVVALQFSLAQRWRIDCTYPHIRPSYEAMLGFSRTIPARASVTLVNAPDGAMLSEVASLARLVATGDWRTNRVAYAANAASVGRPDYVVDLTGADPDRIRTGARTLTATLHRSQLASPPEQSVTLPASCSTR